MGRVDRGLRRPLEDFDDGAVGCAHGQGRTISREALGAQQWQVLPGQLQEERLLAGTRAVSDDHNDRLRTRALRLSLVGDGLSVEGGREGEEKRGEKARRAHAYSAFSS